MSYKKKEKINKREFHWPAKNIYPKHTEKILNAGTLDIFYIKSETTRVATNIILLHYGKKVRHCDDHLWSCPFVKSNSQKSEILPYQTLLIFQRTQVATGRSIMENSGSFPVLWKKIPWSRFKLCSVWMHAGHHFHKGEKFLSWNISILDTRNYMADMDISQWAIRINLQTTGLFTINNLHRSDIS